MYKVFVGSGFLQKYIKYTAAYIFVAFIFVDKMKKKPLIKSVDEKNTKILLYDIILCNIICISICKYICQTPA